MKKLLLISICIIIFICGCSKNNYNESKNYETKLIRTGYKNMTSSYGGQDCIRFSGKLYWISGEVQTDKELIYQGSIKECVDKVPEKDFTSAKAEAGQKIFIEKDNDGVIFLKEDDGNKNSYVTYVLHK